MRFSSGEEIFSLPHFTKVDSFEFDSSVIDEKHKRQDLKFRAWLKNTAIRFQFSAVTDDTAVKASLLSFTFPVLLGEDQDIPFNLKISVVKAHAIEVEFSLSSIKTNRYRLRDDEALEHIEPQLLEVVSEKMPIILGSKKTKDLLERKVQDLQSELHPDALDCIGRVTSLDLLRASFKAIASRGSIQKPLEF